MLKLDVEEAFLQSPLPTKEYFAVAKNNQRNTFLHPNRTHYIYFKIMQSTQLIVHTIHIMQSN